MAPELTQKARTIMRHGVYQNGGIIASLTLLSLKIISGKASCNLDLPKIE